MRLARSHLFVLLSAALLSGACGDDSPSMSPSTDTSRGSDTSNGSWSNGADSMSSSDSLGSWDSQNGQTDPPTNTHISFGGAQDFGYVRGLIADGQVPRPNDLDPAGFFAEHSTPLPDPVCGERICLQAMLAVMGNLMNGNNCTMLQLGLNSPIAVDPNQRPPLTLAVAVDVSGSMSSDRKIDFVRRGLDRLFNELRDGDQLAIIAYSDRATVVWPMQELASARNELHDVVDALTASGTTNLHDGLQRAYDEVARVWQGDRQNRVILLSDGVATAGIVDDASIVAMSAGRNSDGIGLTTIGLGTDFNFNLMRGLAEQADGNFYFLENATAVEEVFTEELAYFTLPVAFDVSVDVRAGTTHRVVSASGSNRFVLDEGGGKLDLASVFFAHRLAHDDVFEGPDGTGRRGGGSMLVVELMPMAPLAGTIAPEVSDIATVTLTWRDPGETEPRTEVLPISYPYAPDHLEPTGFFETAIVTKSFVVLNIYFAIETASTLFHADQAIEARDVLDRVIAAATDYEDSANDGEGDIDIRFDIELMQDLRDVIVTRSQVNQPPAPLPEDPWPAD